VRFERLFVILTLALATVACGSSTERDTAAEPAADATAPTQGAPRVLGSIEATVDGEPGTWYVVSGAIQGEPYSSGFWLQDEPGRWTLQLLAFDTVTPPLDTFERGAFGGPASYGTYTGSSVLLNFELAVEPAPSPFTLTFPSEAPIAVTYASRAAVDSLDSTYAIREGSFSVTSAAAADGLASVSGTFEGTFSGMTGPDTVAITAGRFDITGVPSLAAVR
jgi:hypothetical protein